MYGSRILRPLSESLEMKASGSDHDVVLSGIIRRRQLAAPGDVVHPRKGGAVMMHGARVTVLLM